MASFEQPYSRTAAALDALSIKEDPGSTRADPSIEACKVRSHMSTGDPYVADDVAGSYLQMTCARSNFRAVGWGDADFRKPIITVGVPYTNIQPCNNKFMELAQAMCDAIEAEGGNWYDKRKGTDAHGCKRGHGHLR